MSTFWTIAIDWDRNGDYSSAQDDVTNRVMSAKWSLGFDELYTNLADNTLLRLTLNNTDRLFSPENASSPLFSKLVPQRPVRQSLQREQNADCDDLARTSMLQVCAVRVTTSNSHPYFPAPLVSRCWCELFRREL